MRVKELHLQNFRVFEELNIKFPSSNLAVFIGVNGSGKSSILDGLAMLFYQSIGFLLLDIEDNVETLGLAASDVNTKASSTQNQIKLEIDQQNYTFSNKIETVLPLAEEPIFDTHPYLLKDYVSVDKNVAILVYYPTKRSFQTNKEESKRNYVSPQFKAYENAFSKNGIDFTDFANWFIEHENIENEEKINQKNFDYQSRQLKVIRQAIEVFLSELSVKDTFSHLRVKRSNSDGFNFRSRQSSAQLIITKNEEDLSLEQLSAGEKTLLMMVCDIVRRLNIANPSANAEMVLQGQGIVLIDEIELHLHPSWQRMVLPALLHTFPNIQFIVTTHSPLVLGNIQRENIFILEEGKIVENTPYSYGRDVNSVLFDLQGVESRSRTFKEKLQTLYHLIDEEKREEAKAMIHELSKDLGENDHEIVRANTYIDLMD